MVIPYLSDFSHLRPAMERRQLWQTLLARLPGCFFNLALCVLAALLFRQRNLWGDVLPVYPYLPCPLSNVGGRGRREAGFENDYKSIFLKWFVILRGDANHVEGKAPIV